MIFTCWGVNIFPRTSPISAEKGAIQRLMVRTETPYLQANWSKVIGCMSLLLFIFDNLERVRLFQGFTVDGLDGRLESRIVLNVVFSLYGVVCCGKNHKVCGVGEELWRHCGHAVANRDNVNVIVSCRNQHVFQVNAWLIEQVGTAVVKH